jgi:hypothetical protein
MYVDDPRKNRNITAMLCTQRLQEVLLNVTYSGSANNLLPDLSGPVIVRNEASSLEDSGSGIKSLTTAMATNFALEMFPFDKQSTPNYDNFFNHLILGPGGHTQEELLDPAALESAIEELYQRYMVHVIDLNFRSKTVVGNIAYADGEDQGQPATRPTRLSGRITALATRLKMSEGSRIALDVMLGTMMVLGIIAYLSTDIRHLLPRNPWSLASSMAFFADSEVCKQYDPTIRGANEAFFKGLKREKLSLGWWTNRAKLNLVEKVKPDPTAQKVTEVNGATDQQVDKQPGTPTQNAPIAGQVLEQGDNLQVSLPMIAVAVTERQSSADMNTVQHIKCKPIPSQTIVTPATQVGRDVTENTAPRVRQMKTTDDLGGAVSSKHSEIEKVGEIRMESKYESSNQKIAGTTSKAAERFGIDIAGDKLLKSRISTSTDGLWERLLRKIR